MICMQKGSTLLLEQRVTSKFSLFRLQKAQDRCTDEKLFLLAADSVILTALMKKRKSLSFDEKALMEKNMNINKSNPLADQIENIINIQKVLPDKNIKRSS